MIQNVADRALLTNRYGRRSAALRAENDSSSSFLRVLRFPSSLRASLRVLRAFVAFFFRQNRGRAHAFGWRLSGRARAHRAAHHADAASQLATTERAHRL